MNDIGLFQKILLAVDLSSNCNNSIEIAAALGLAGQADVEILHIPEFFVSPEESINLEEPVEVEKILESYLEYLLKRGVKARKTILGSAGTHGQVASLILAHAQKTNAELIIIGHSLKGRISHLLVGNVTSELTRKPPCSVLVVKGCYEKD